MGKVTSYPVPDAIIVSDESEVGEGPVFDPRTGRLVWVDIYGGKVFENDLNTGEQTTTKVGTMVGAVAPRRDREGFAAAVSEGFGFLANGTLEIADPVLPEPELRMNDGKVDSRGRFWAGSNEMGFRAGMGRLHRWDGTTPSVVMASGLVLPNGLGWDAGDSLMYLADSYANLLYSAPFRADEGEIGPLRVLTEVDGPGVPDGMAVDVDGCIWVAMSAGSEVRRYSPAGEVIGVVAMPVSQPSSCTFRDDGTLFITSARHGLSAGRLRAEPLAGSVFALATGTRGVPVESFRG